MAQRQITVEGIGEVILAKRRGSTNIRLSINPKGQVRVAMPYWAPYAAGLAFLNSKSDWVRKHKQAQAPKQLADGALIGKAHRLRFKTGIARGAVADIRLTATTTE